MLDARLLNKRLDVRIAGTRKTLFHNGRYEGQFGYTVLTEVPTSTAAPVTVKVGFAESSISVHPQYLYPMMTTERPGFVSEANALPVISVPQQRVIIIGPDMYGGSDAVGSYAEITAPMFPLPQDHAVIRYLDGPFIGIGQYFRVESLCRSHPEPVTWKGVIIM